MTITFQCEHCRKEVKAPDDAAGQRGKCPFCGETSYIPTEVSEDDVLPLAEVDEQEERERERKMQQLVEDEQARLSEEDLKQEIPLDQRDNVSSHDLHHFVVNYCLDMAEGKMERAAQHAAKLKNYGHTGSQAVEDFLTGNALEPALDKLPAKVRNGYLNQLAETLRK